ILYEAPQPALDDGRPTTDDRPPTTDDQAATAGEAEVGIDVGRSSVAGRPSSSGELLFSENFACVDCGISLEEIAPRNFSFNSPYGACPACHGLGTHTEFDEHLILDSELSPREGGVLPFEIGRAHV